VLKCRKEKGINPQRVNREMNRGSVQVRAASTLEKFSHLFLLVLTSGMLGCLETTAPKVGEASEEETVTYASNYCQGSKLTNSPFANSGIGGDGLSEKTAFTICNVTQFNAIGSSSSYWDKRFVILQNINLLTLNSTSYQRIGSSTTPFTGVFDGQGKSILNLNYISSNNYVGLFGALGANGVVKNVTLKNFTITGNNYLGVLAGYNEGAMVTGVTIQANYISGGNYVGGLIGQNYDGDISNCSVDFIASVSSVQGNQWVGGIVGDLVSGSLQLSTLNGRSISATGNYIGGLAGIVQENGEIRSSSVTLIGGVTGLNYVGGVVGSTDGVIYKSWAAIERVGGTTNWMGGVAGYCDDGSLIESYSIITNRVAGNNGVGGVVGGLDTCTVEGSYIEVPLVQGTTGGAGGVVGISTTGKIKNSYAKITNLTATSGNYVGGIVGLMNSGAIILENSYAKITNINASAVDNVGGLVGAKLGGEILTSYSKITGAFTGRDNAGGAIGYQSAGDTKDVYVEFDDLTSATGDYVGGFVGNLVGGQIIDSYVVSTGEIIGNDYTGGFVGYASAQVLQSYAHLVDVTGSGAPAGGFAGEINGTNFINNYVKATSGVLTGVDQVGGFAGSLQSSSVSNSYSVWQDVVGTSTGVGGFIGATLTSVVVNSFSAANVEGNDPSATPITDPQTVGFFVGDLGWSLGTSVSTLTNVYAFGSGNPAYLCTNLSGVCNNPADTTSFPGIELAIGNQPTYFYNSSNAPLSSWDFTNYWQEKTSDYPALR